MTRQPAATGRDSIWTGLTNLELRNGRDWVSGYVEVEAGLDVLQIRFQGREVAVIDRDQFRTWLWAPSFGLFVAGGTRWANDQGEIHLTMGYSTFAVDPQSWADLAEVI